ncbi:hypothetical protein QBC38DRAFT_459534 [Podospora fimiseda]|uniref:Uncharacterized protein n=1 Tax=Podospora fimiseda TaxID=252190 RepID=A0AAN7GNK5_9PEZI|nr:hypothetical protein QBC38DRAFT_459534 [Podospora fimiseda]
MPKSKSKDLFIWDALTSPGREWADHKRDRNRRQRDRDGGESGDENGGSSTHNEYYFKRVKASDKKNTCRSANGTTGMIVYSLFVVGGEISPVALVESAGWDDKPQPQPHIYEPIYRDPAQSSRQGQARGQAQGQDRVQNQGQVLGEIREENEAGTETNLRGGQWCQGSWYSQSSFGSGYEGMPSLLHSHMVMMDRYPETGPSQMYGHGQGQGYPVSVSSSSSSVSSDGRSNGGSVASSVLFLKDSPGTSVVNARDPAPAYSKWDDGQNLRRRVSAPPSYVSRVKEEEGGYESGGSADTIRPGGVLRCLVRGGEDGNYWELGR